MALLIEIQYTACLKRMEQMEILYLPQFFLIIFKVIR